jgi:small subunit ribosomal protein S9
MPTETVLKATGRRKTASASAIITPGKGSITINGRDHTDYFTTENMRALVVRPLEVVEVAKKYDITAKASGGGLMGQAGALRHAISRALLKVNPEFRPALKKEGFLTRDPREKERKKSGQPGARKRFQFSKR